MQLSNALSDTVVAVVSLFVFFRYFSQTPFYNKLLWGIFVVTVALAAATGTIRFLGVDSVKFLHTSLTTLAGSLGLSCAVVAIYGLVLSQTFRRNVLIFTTIVGIFIYVLLSYPAFKPFQQVVASLAMLVAMLIAVFGLLQKYKKALWIVIGIMIIGIATKLMANYSATVATDMYHYALAGMILCFGKAV